MDGLEDVIQKGEKVLVDLRKAKVFISDAETSIYMYFLGSDLAAAGERHLSLKTAKRHIENAKVDIAEFADALSGMDEDLRREVDAESFMSFSSWVRETLYTEKMRGRRMKRNKECIEKARVEVERILGVLKTASGTVE